MTESVRGTLGEILSASQIITPDDVTAALEEQKRAGCRFGEALVRLGIVTQEDIDWALSNQLDIPYIRLKQEMIDPVAVFLIPASMARQHNCIPLIRAGDELHVALADPLNRMAVEAIELESGCSVSVSVALIREIREMIDAFYGCDQQDSLGFDSPLFSPDALDAINADLSGGILLDYLLIHALQNRLTSLSLQPLGDVIKIRGKRGDTASTIGTLQPKHYPDVTLGLRRAATGLPSGATSGRGILTFNYRSREVPFQVLVMTGVGGDFITVGLHTDSRIPTRLGDLHLPTAQEAAFAGLARAERGVTFFTSRIQRERECFMDLMLEESDTDGRNVIILGTGPGRMQKRFPQIPLPESAVDLARLVMNCLDHDPDILVIEDASEGPVFRAACRAGMRGKRILAGLDIQGTRSVLQHLLHQQRNLLLPVFVNGVVSVTGIRLLCPSCKQEFSPPHEELAAMRLEQPLPLFYRAQGCEQCHYLGMSERRFLVDVLPLDEPLLQAFGQSTDVAALDKYLRETGHGGIAAEALGFLKRGEISPEEYIAAIIL